MLWGGIYPYEYMDIWERFDETFPSKNEVYSNLNVEDKTDSDYKHVRRVWKEFEMKRLGKYHDLYVEIDTDVFHKCRSTCIEIYGLDPAYLLSGLGTSWQVCLKASTFS